ncbi:putative Swi5-dependent recombination DNA repair protein 1 [Glarea lozoyensis 74030]|uniref:Putative Swi5-dependent recombination DNA repair protein 1 n=1 Tax=Glarea lozoyensis (strain ATCC 74030 / MF5533) TaxID=1104152 RepID=H0EXR9_GLAL7|nr:putative Swi5-dependent recombination DNA repair protein 1 [Glarea lozoyensis 74030]
MNDASKTLSKPFRSPFKTPFKSPSKAVDSEINQASSTGKLPVLGEKTPNLLANPATPGARTKKTFTSPLQTARINADPTIAPLLRTQRELEKELRQLKEDLDTAEQARKIEAGKRGDDGEVDAELRVLVAKWKSASRMAAEEMFGRQADSRSQWEAEQNEPVGEDDDSDEDPAAREERKTRKRELADQYDIEVETVSERSQRNVIDDGAKNGDEDEFTMAMMLRTLNVELHVIGFDRDEERFALI